MQSLSVAFLTFSYFILSLFNMKKYFKMISSLFKKKRNQ